MKKVFYLLIVFLVSIVYVENVYASNPIVARIGNMYFDTLEDAIKEAKSDDIIILTSDISLNETLEINKNININLNNHSIAADEKVFAIHGGSLNLSGMGTIYEKKPNYGAIYLLGSKNSSNKYFSTLSVGKDVTLQGWSGIFINQNNKAGYGILVNMNGKINAVNDINNNPGAGIYVNGSIYDETNSPIINLSSDANISSTGSGIYAAGFATYNIDGAYIAGQYSGLGIKSGVFNIINGTIISDGKDNTPTTGNNNGINASGCAIQIESNKNYKGNIDITIKSGLINSKYSNVVYEYTVGSSSQIKNINISGGKFISDANKEVFSFSNDFNSKTPQFISGGIYSSDPIKYLENTYTTVKNSSKLYEVINKTTSVASYNQFKTSIPLFLIILIIVGVIYITIHYLIKKNILVFLKY